jgi:branched-chain amino acid transport system substrate-binding protein
MKPLKQLALVLAACGALLTAARAEDTINVAAIYATSGPASIYGGPAEKALRMMIDNLPNKSIDGKPVKLTVYDTEGNSTKAAQLFRRAAETDEAVLIFGPSTSGESLAIAPIANQMKVPTISNGGAEGITKPVTPYMFAVGPTDRLMVEAIIASIKEHGWKKIAVLYSMDGYGQSGGTISQELVKSSGLDLVAVETFASQDTNMTPQLLRIRDKDPDAIILWSANPGPTIVARNAVEMGLKKPILVSTANATIGFINQTGAAANGIIATTLPVVAPEALADSDPRKAIIQRFNKQYMDKYGLPADQASGLGFDNFLLLEAAVKSIKGPVTRESMRTAIENIKMCGANGCRQMRPDDHRGLTKDSIVMMQIKDGGFVAAK